MHSLTEKIFSTKNILLFRERKIALNFVQFWSLLFNNFFWVKQKQKPRFFFAILWLEKIYKKAVTCRDRTTQALVHSTNIRSFLSESWASEWMNNQKEKIFSSYTHLQSDGAFTREKERKISDRQSVWNKMKIIVNVVSERERKKRITVLLSGLRKTHAWKVFILLLLLHLSVLTEKLNMKNHLSMTRAFDVHFGKNLFSFRLVHWFFSC